MPKNDSFGSQMNANMPNWWNQIIAPSLVVGSVILISLFLASSLRLSLFPVEGLDPQTWEYSKAFLIWFTLATFQTLAVLLILAYVQSFAPGQIVFTFALQRPYASVGEIASTVSLVVAALAGLSWIAFNFFWSDVERDLRLFKNLIAESNLIVPLLVLCIGAPLAEELLFRGYLFGHLSKSVLGPVWAAVLSSFGWTLLHYGYSPVGMVYVFAAGLLFTWALWRTGSLWVPLFMHGIYNAAVFSIIVSMT